MGREMTLFWAITCYLMLRSMSSLLKLVRVVTLMVCLMSLFLNSSVSSGCAFILGVTSGLSKLEKVNSWRVVYLVPSLPRN